ncbi:MAG: response regulator transcription factor [Candidatus Dormibacteraeota bacterium]|nr:response regulator transcription factor [Candidatus Dormibacteraeota bacterium]
METSVATGQIRVLIADDQTLFRSGLARLLQEFPDISVVAEAVDGEDAVEKAAKHRPDVVLMDVKMPRLSGIDATRRILADRDDVKVLILTTFSTDVYVLDALRAGAAGYVLKDSPTEAIASSLRAVVAQERVLSGSVANRVLAMLTGETDSREYYDGLTARELEILKMIASGMGNKQVAYRLQISEKTVRNHISHIYEKLEIYDRSQAVLYAVRKGLVEL